MIISDLEQKYLGINNCFLILKKPLCSRVFKNSRLLQQTKRMGWSKICEKKLAPLHFFIRCKFHYFWLVVVSYHATIPSIVVFGRNHRHQAAASLWKITADLNFFFRSFHLLLVLRIDCSKIFKIPPLIQLITSASILIDSDLHTHTHKLIINQIALFSLKFSFFSFFFRNESFISMNATKAILKEIILHLFFPFHILGPRTKY